MNVLCLSPHTDDAEISAGGTISRMVREGHDICVMVFSPCIASIPAGWRGSSTREECRAAMRTLGIGRVDVLDYAVRHFPSHRQSILEDMIKMRQDFRPNMVLMPSVSDVHQDHRVIAEEGIRAFKTCGTVLSWESVKNMSPSMQGSCYMQISDEDLSQKTCACECYRSQCARNPSTDILKALAMVRGRQAGVDYAEMFEVVRWTMRT